MAGFDASAVHTVGLQLNPFIDDTPIREQKLTRLNAQSKFGLFLSSFRGAPGTAEMFPYRAQIKANFDQREYRFTVDMKELAAFSQELCDAFIRRPDDYLEFLQSAAKDIIASTTAGQLELDKIPTMQCELTNFPTRDDDKDERGKSKMRTLAAPNVEQLVSVSGIIINAAKPRIKATMLALVCRNCKSVKYIPCGAGFGMARMPRTCDAAQTGETKKCPIDPFQILPDTTKYIDQQRLKLQESPESVPTGEMPRSLSLSAERYLVGRVKPGQHVRVIGVYTTFQQKMERAGSRAAQAAGSTAREVGIRLPYLRVLGLEVENDDGSSSFTPEQEEQIQKLSRNPNLYNVITESIGPAIYGNEEIKKALACQLFGGARKHLPDGMKLRGDINVLLLGDPSVGKSQFLKFAFNLAPVGVYTSGKGASAAGLTASVIRDPSTGEFQLEGGALVLGNGGLVCIDEFDKMREQDRVAIHEAMEQQTISIAKAGITTILKSETSVLAAANPVFGRYDDMKSPTENIDFQTTILSRFDIIFILRDVQDATRDKALVKYILGVHQHSQQMVNDKRDSGSIIEVAALKKYIEYARKKLNPRLSEDAAKVLQAHYITLRSEYRKHKSEHGNSTPIPITVRQLEAIIRISESLARLELKDIATPAHVHEAIRLFKVSTFQAATSSYGESAAAGTPQFGEKVQAYERIIRRRVPLGSKVQRARLIADTVGPTPAQIDENACNKAIDIMTQRSEFKPYAQGKLLERLR